MSDYLLVENRLIPLRQTLRFSTGNGGFLTEKQAGFS